jgi:hypothetical protein
MRHLLFGEYIDQPTICWNVEKLNTFFLPMDVEIPRNIPLRTRWHEDFWAW